MPSQRSHTLPRFDRHVLLCVLACASLFSPSILAQIPPPTATISPTDLLAALPPVPDDWKLLKSVGSNKFSVLSQPQTVVTRNYEVPQPPQTPPPPVLPPPGFIAIDVLDMGSAGNGSQNATPPSKTPPKDLFDLPLVKGGHLKTRPDKSSFFYGPLGTRMLIQVSCHDIKPEDFKKILKAFNFTVLASVEQKLPVTPLKEVSYSNTLAGHTFKYKSFVTDNVFVDELNPKLNRSWQGAAIQQQP